MTSKLTRMFAIFLLLAGTAGSVGILSSSAEAGRLKLMNREFRVQRLAQPQLAPWDVAQSLDDPSFNDEGGDFDAEEPGGGGVTIRPRQAARIARDMVPGSKVLNVKLLPSGVYAVTLRGDGKLTRVMVDGRSGDIL